MRTTRKRRRREVNARVTATGAMCLVMDTMLAQMDAEFDRIREDEYFRWWDNWNYE